jgi:hypothetical protein
MQIFVLIKLKFILNRNNLSKICVPYILPLLFLGDKNLLAIALPNYLKLGDPSLSWFEFLMD